MFRVLVNGASARLRVAFGFALFAATRKGTCCCYAALTTAPTTKSAADGSASDGQHQHSRDGTTSCSATNHPHVDCYDVAIIGAGVFGLSTAWHLAKLGRKVAILERTEVGSPTEASSVNAGFIENYSHFGSVNGDDPRSLLETDDDLEDVLHSGTLAIYADLALRHPNIEFERMGLLELLESPEQVDLAVEELELPFLTPELWKDEQWSPPPDGSIIVDLDLLREIEPMVVPAVGNVSDSTTLGAILYPNCATTHPAKTMRAMKSEALKEGAVVLEGVQVESIVRIDGSSSEDSGGGECGGWAIAGRTLNDSYLPDADDGEPRTVQARDVVVACGGLSDAVLRTALRNSGDDDGTEADAEETDNSEDDCDVVLPVIPVIGQMFRTAPEQSGVRSLKHLISSFESTMYWYNERTHPHEVTHERKLVEGGSETGVWGPRLTRHLYGKQTREGEYLFGGDRRVHPPIQNLEGFHPLPRIFDDGHKSCFQHAVEAVSAVGDLPVVHRWGGIMSYSPDGAPLAGRVTLPGKEDIRPSDGLWVATGLGGCGFTRGAMAGLLLAEVIGKGPLASEAEEFLESADPDRFRQEHCVR